VTQSPAIELNLSVRNCVFLATLLMVVTPSGFAQSPAIPGAAFTKPRTFDVISIRTSKPNGMMSAQYPPDGYSALGVSMRMLILEAYGGDVLLSDGPSWLDSEHFDIEAKFDVSGYPDPKNIPYDREQRRAMMKALLAERFQLKTHYETKETPVFNLVIADKDPKLKESVAAQCIVRRNRPGDLSVEGCSMKNFVALLRYYAGRTVLDKTSLTGRYDAPLHWAPDGTPDNAAAESGPSLFTAVKEQLGLKLVPSQAPLDVLVIDSVAQPSSN
jgi:uncharacterized protein (TIGR03435 family)